MLAVSLDILPNIMCHQTFKSLMQTRHLSQAGALCPAEHINEPVLNLPGRSTAFTCRHTETFLVLIKYTPFASSGLPESRFSVSQSQFASPKSSSRSLELSMERAFSPIMRNFWFFCGVFVDT